MVLQPTNVHGKGSLMDTRIDVGATTLPTELPYVALVVVVISKTTRVRSNALVVGNVNVVLPYGMLEGLFTLHLLLVDT